MRQALGLDSENSTAVPTGPGGEKEEKGRKEDWAVGSSFLGYSVPLLSFRGPSEVSCVYKGMP